MKYPNNLSINVTNLLNFKLYSISVGISLVPYEIMSTFEIGIKA
jgi:hypothetical protein